MIYHKPTETQYHRGHLVWFSEPDQHWIINNPKPNWVEDAAFDSPFYIEGNKEHLPDHLKPTL
jgi:hypothetical protein